MVSSQYFLDCTAKANCDDFYIRQALYQIATPAGRDIPLVGEYPRAETGARGACASPSVSSVNQQRMVPKIVDYVGPIVLESAVEDLVLGGPVLARILIPTNVLQFYTSGVVTSDMCKDFRVSKRYYHTTITGFTRTGANGSGPFW